MPKRKRKGFDKDVGIIYQKRKKRSCLGYCGKMFLSTKGNRICNACSLRQQQMVTLLEERNMHIQRIHYENS